MGDEGSMLLSFQTHEVWALGYSYTPSVFLLWVQLELADPNGF